MDYCPPLPARRDNCVAGNCDSEITGAIMKRREIITSDFENQHLLVLRQERDFLMHRVLHRVAVHPQDLIAYLKPK